MARILLVDDDQDLVDVMTFALGKNGHDVRVVDNGDAAINECRANEPDLVLLDLVLPGRDGVSVCRTIRSWLDVPIIIVSGLVDEGHIIQSFAAGADDFVAKPFSHRQLAVRIQAALKRSGHPPLTDTRTELRFGEMELDPQSHELRHADRMVRLTPIECRLLQLLVLNRGHVVSTERLIEFAWRYEGGDTRLLRTHVSHLRRKLQVTKGALGYITAVSRVGYFLTAA